MNIQFSKYKPRTDSPSKSTAMVKDMTTGNPLKLILLFAIPLFIGNIFQQVYNMVDTMVVGRALGDDAIAAIGATNSLYALIVNFCWALNNGYAIVSTHRFGAHDKKGFRQSVAGMMVLDIIITALLTTLSLLFLPQLMRFMNTPDGIFDEAYIYIAIIYGGMISTIGYNMFAGILRAMGNSRAPLYFLIISSVLNVILDITFVMGIEMGLAGAALATIIAQTISAILCGGYFFKNYRDMWPKKDDFHLSRSMWSELISTGFAMAMMVTVIDLGSVIYTRANNILGETIIAAHAASRRLMSMMMQPLVTIASANSTFVGQNWGAGKVTRIRETLKKVLLVQSAWAVIAWAIIWIFGEFLVQFTTGTSDPEVIRNAVMSLRINFSFFIPLGIIFVMRNTMQAMGHKTAPVLASCIELAMKIISAIFLIPKLGFLGTCMTEPVTWVFMAAFLLIVYAMQRKKLFETENA